MIDSPDPPTDTASRLTTWAKLVKAEPQLAGLLREIRRVRDDKAKPSFCANARWYGYFGHSSFKQRLLPLVGWDAVDAPEFLRSMEAYNVAYQKLYEALPDCRNCNCM